MSNPVLEAKLAVRLELRRRFTELRLEASRLLTEAEKVCIGLSDIELQQVRAAGKLAGVDFYSIVGPAGPKDFERLREDLVHVARAVDPLIEAIGTDARINSTEITDRDLKEDFMGVIAGAIEGNALYLLDTCADEAREVIEEPAAAE
jgi:hypothetical protein